ncbi:unnamed protein product [Adineta steineri]|uniref:Uncharacterized protein n=1 Tax=Adineta steineri TaxID=433720 RepID=A0A819VU60_9BILA|nr:unnamed protein product [Adineta steineri]CAF4113663.1 unnamed protein product [Adineta steineri]
MLQATRIRSEKHRREKIRLQGARYVVVASKLIIIIFSIIVASYGVALGFMEIGKRYEMWKEKDLLELVQLLLTDKFGTCIVGILGFAISIAAQITFPAP